MRAIIFLLLLTSFSAALVSQADGVQPQTSSTLPSIQEIGSMLLEDCADRQDVPCICRIAREHNRSEICEKIDDPAIQSVCKAESDSQSGMADGPCWAPQKSLCDVLEDMKFLLQTILIIFGLTVYALKAIRAKGKRNVIGLGIKSIVLLAFLLVLFEIIFTGIIGGACPLA